MGIRIYTPTYQLMQELLSQKLEKLFNLRNRGIKPGLSRMRNLVQFLRHPEKEYPIIHVAGTNGKGSTCRIIHSILVEAGYKTGLYTSPHLRCFNERIKINHTDITNDELLALFKKFDSYFDESKASFFEITTAIALDYFYQKNVEIVILEVGLGGRFDATNIVSPVMSVITPISKDHEEFLGNDLLQIAREKAGIIKPGVPVIISKQNKEINNIIQKIADLNRAKYFSSSDTCNIQINKLDLDGQLINLQIDDQFFYNIKFPMLGVHQIENLMTALTALSKYPGLKLNHKLLNSGLKRLVNPGRFEIIDTNPAVIYDVAHNTAGIKSTIETMLSIFPEEKIDLLLSLKSGKKLKNPGFLFKQLGGKIYISEMANIESEKIENIITQFNNEINNEKIIFNKNMDKLLETIEKERMNPLLILGSHYMAKKIYKLKKYLTNNQNNNSLRHHTTIYP